MKKILLFVFVAAFALLLTPVFSTTAFAATKTVNYYDENGNAITVNGMYYNSAGYPCYNASSYYVDANGNTVYVGGSRCYYYNPQGNLAAGNYYYNTNGTTVSNNSRYWGCGMWYYNAQGNVVNSTTYYDDFGNPVDPPAASAPVYRGHGCGCRRW